MPTFTPDATTTTQETTTTEATTTTAPIAPIAPTINPDVDTTPALLTTTTRSEQVDPEPPEVKCDLNCYGESSTSVAFDEGVAFDPASDPGTQFDSEEVCAQKCIAMHDSNGCEAVVWQESSKTCWAKKDVNTYKCPQGEGGFETNFVTHPLGPIGVCAVVGDPHILTFDNSQGVIGDNTELHHGHFNLVSSSTLQIQGRFGYTKRFASAASLTGIAAGGSYMGGNTLVFTYTGDGETMGVAGMTATWNNEKILEGGLGTSYTSPDGVLEASCDMMDPQKYHESARNTYGGTSGLKSSYLFIIKPELQIYILIGDAGDAMNAVIQVRKINGMDGWCGNLNCDPEDDTIPKITERGLAASCPQDESLFKHAAPLSEYQQIPAGPVPSLETCDPAVKEEAKNGVCAGKGNFMDSCVLDECAADATAKLQVQGKSAADVGFVFRFMSMPGWLQATCALVVAGLFGAGVVAGRPFQRRRHGMYDTLGVDEGPERESSRTVRMSFEEDAEPGFFDAPLASLSRFRTSATSILVARPSQTDELSSEEYEEALLDAVAFEHDAL